MHSMLISYGRTVLAACLAFVALSCSGQAGDAITVFTVTNDLAQNVNFAIKANVVTNFLDANSVAYTSGSLGSTALQPSEIAGVQSL